MKNFLFTPIALALLLTGCAINGSDGKVPSQSTALSSCSSMLQAFTFANTKLTSATDAPAGSATVAHKPIAAHCIVKGEMHRRVSPVDAQSYAIGFEMRLPSNWNGRFFHQANGGAAGVVIAATGPVGGGGAMDNALNQGFVVLSSDVGHGPRQNPSFGVDPQARVDNGYGATQALTPMAKALIRSAYGRTPDRSYMGGCSNGGRHAIVAASRFGQDYDGFIIGDPGINLPLASVANIKGAQILASLATTPDVPAACDLADGKADGKVAGAAGISACQAILETGLTLAERTTVTHAILAQCDALDGLRDGMVQDIAACQTTFELARDVPTCTGARNGSCLTSDQKLSVAQLFDGAPTSAGQRIYARFPYDAGLNTKGWAEWKFGAPLNRDSGSAAMLFATPPETVAGFNGPSFALIGDVDRMLARVYATSPTYPEAAMSFMPPLDVTRFETVRHRGGKLILYHGTSDPIFSSDDTTQWLNRLQAANGGDSSSFARLYPVPGMNHCSGGPSTDQFDMLSPLVDWVERGKAPERIIATARGVGNAGGVNSDVPATWAIDRTRPLCPHPQVARYIGGDTEKATSFVCR